MPQATTVGQDQITGARASQRPVLVPLDGSPLAERALPWGRELAARRGAPLLLARVVQLLTYAGVPDLTAIAVTESTLEGERAAAAAYLDTLAAPLRAASPPIDVRTTARLGDPATVLLALEGEQDVQVIVMSSHARSGLERWFRGSVAEALLSRGTAPVLLVRPTDDPAQAAALARDDVRVLVPLDGSDFATLALPEAGNVFAGGAVEIMLAGVVPARDAPFDTDAARTGAWERASTQRYLDAAALELRRRYSRPAKTVVLTADDPAAAIVELATLEEIDLIAMSTHGRGGLGRLVYGSVADAVSRGSPAPVLLVRPDAASRRTLLSSSADPGDGTSDRLPSSEGEYPKK